MRSLQQLFQNNRNWAREVEQSQPGFFKRLAQQQSPEYLWIGCSDSRVPANQITGLAPGEMFVHRNIANQVIHTDINCLSVIQFAVDALKVKHIIVCGHYNCGGIRAALQNETEGAINSWLRHIQDVYEDYGSHFENLSQDEKVESLCRLNVIAQVRHVCRTGVVNRAWEKGQQLMVHSWIYGLGDGQLHDLEFSPAAADEVASAFQKALKGIGIG